MSIQLNRKKKYILVFFFPIIFINTVFLLLKVAPFGEASIWYVDLPSQIVYFYKYLLDTLCGKESLVYSVNYGMGESFWATFTYYLSSPLSLFICFFKFFPPNWVKFAPLVIWMIKLGLSGVTMMLLLKRQCTSSSKIAFLFSSIYSMIGFSLMYYFLPMWIDAVYMLPVLVLGIYHLIYDHQNKLFLFSLVYLFFANFYTAYMAGIFLFLFFLAELYIARLKKADVIKKVLLFFESVIWAALFTLFIYVPTFFSIRENSYSRQKDLFENIFHIDFFAVYKAFFNSTAEVQNLTLYCSILSILLVPLFFVLKNIDKREKISYGLLFIILFISVGNQQLNYIWQVFETPNGAPYRFVFVLSFFVVFLSCKAFSKLNELPQIPKKTIMMITCIDLAGLLLIFYDLSKPISNLLFLLSFSLVLVNLKMNHRKHLFIVVPLLIIADLGVNTFNLYQQYSQSKESISGNFYSQDNPSYEGLIDYVKKKDHGFYRIHIDNQLHLQANESLKYNYKNMNIYTSTSNFQVNSFLTYLGYRAMPRYVEMDKGHLLADMLFNFQYFVTRSSMDERLYELIREVRGLKVYKNKFAVPFGYPINSDMMQLDGSADIIERQNLLLDGTEKYYRHISQDEMRFSETKDWAYETSNTGDGKLESRRILTYRYQVNGLNDLYLELDYGQLINPRLDDIQIHINGEKIVPSKNEYTFNSIHLGIFQDESVVVKVSFPETLYFFQPQIIELNCDKLNDKLESLRKNGVTNYKETSTQISGTVETHQKIDYLVTVPYDQNWSVLLDGKKVSYVKRGAFISFSIPAGKHTILLKYQPKLLYSCLLISFVTFVVYLICCRRRTNYL